MSGQQRSAVVRRPAVYRYACTRGDLIIKLARRLGYDLDRLGDDGLPILTDAEGERALDQLHRERDDDQPWGSRR